MLEQRVAGLESGMKDIQATLLKVNERLLGIETELKHLPKATDYGALRADIAEVKGRLATSPTMWQLLTMVISTWAAGAAIVFAILRFGVK
jgi:hypothetical protein